MERLLPRALRSLRAQTLTDFEAILINDGSKDGSAALCAQAVAEDARFRFIDQPNGGVATARNAGLDAARGEYIFFLDPDDWVEPDAAEVLYHAARNADADCVEFGLYLDSYDENDRLLHTQTSGSTLSGVYRGAPFKEHFDETASSYLVTNKLFRRAFLEQHRLRFSCHQLADAAEGEIPSILVENAYQQQMQVIQQQLQMQRMSLNTYLSQIHETRESFTAKVRAAAEKNTRARMALLQIAQQENLLPTDEEIDKQLAERAEKTKKTVEEIKASTDVAALRRNEGIRKAADWVIDHSTIEEKVESK